LQHCDTDEILISRIINAFRWATLEFEISTIDISEYYKGLPLRSRPTYRKIFDRGLRYLDKNFLVKRDLRKINRVSYREIVSPILQMVEKDKQNILNDPNDTGNLAISLREESLAIATELTRILNTFYSAAESSKSKFHKRLTYSIQLLDKTQGVMTSQGK